VLKRYPQRGTVKSATNNEGKNSAFERGNFYAFGKKVIRVVKIADRERERE
jgi:hypothetical protein